MTGGRISRHNISGVAAGHTVKNSILLILTAAALGAMFFTVGGARDPVRTTATISGPVRVIDGDTVVVAGTTVRLKGVDAAERETARGENAKRVMVGLVTSELTCRLTGEKTWGREVGRELPSPSSACNQCPAFNSNSMSMKFALVAWRFFPKGAITMPAKFSLGLSPSVLMGRSSTRCLAVAPLRTKILPAREGDSADRLEY